MVTTLASNADILPEVEGFLKQTGLPVTTFGRRAIGDANLVENLRAGRELRRATRQKVRDFMREYRTPAQAEAA